MMRYTASNMISIIGVGLYGLMSWYGSGRRGRIPGRLIVKSDDIWLSTGDAAITGNRGVELSASAAGDYLAVTSSGNPEVIDTADGLRITGDSEQAVYAVDYLLSKLEISAAYQDDGLLITYAADAVFDLEKLTIEEYENY